MLSSRPSGARAGTHIPAVVHGPRLSCHRASQTRVNALEALGREGLLPPGQIVWYNAGIYIFTPILFDFTARLQKSPRGEYELTDAIRGLAQSGKKVKAFELSGEWADVRDPEILAQLNQL